mmetsp:Transcript_2892/g.6053  ORF Transcript_2892/g.6053 Transcript_2892/m.6053 type:complete len:278 (+) Transcript_2892:654-1487(+)
MRMYAQTWIETALWCVIETPCAPLYERDRAWSPYDGLARRADTYPCASLAWPAAYPDAAYPLALLKSAPVTSAWPKAAPVTSASAKLALLSKAVEKSADWQLVPLKSALVSSAFWKSAPRRYAFVQLVDHSLALTSCEPPILACAKLPLDIVALAKEACVSVAPTKFGASNEAPSRKAWSNEAPAKETVETAVESWKETRLRLAPSKRAPVTSEPWMIAPSRFAQRRSAKVRSTHMSKTAPGAASAAHSFGGCEARRGSGCSGWVQSISCGCGCRRG